MLARTSIIKYTAVSYINLKDQHHPSPTQCKDWQDGYDYEPTKNLILPNFKPMFVGLLFSGKN